MIVAQHQRFFRLFETRDQVAPEIEILLPLRLGHRFATLPWQIPRSQQFDLDQHCAGIVSRHQMLLIAHWQTDNRWGLHMQPRQAINGKPVAFRVGTALIVEDA